MVQEQRRAAGEAASDPGRPAPGALSRLLEEVARAPEWSLEEAWQKGLRPGQTVGRFELVRELGRGGFGVVFEARDRELGRLVAFKAIHPGQPERGEVRELLRLEAETIAQLNHPNIVTLHDIGRCETGPYLILELLRGETLEQRLERGPFPVGQAVSVAADIVRALAHAHAAGVLHRDLKPSNVFLGSDGTVKVLDFGLARVFGHDSPSGGTPAYMAPEQWSDAPQDGRLDLFAVGVLLFKMLDGRHPFAGVELPPLADRVATRLAGPGISPALADLVAAMLSVDPAGRPRDARAVLDALVSIQRELDRAGARRRRTGTVIGAAALAAVAAAAWHARRDHGPASDADRPVVVVADAANATGEPELDALSGLLSTALEPSRRIAVLPRSRMLDLARGQGAEPARIDEARAREICHEIGARALLLPAVSRTAGGYAVEARLVDPDGGAYLYSGREDGRERAEIPGMVDRLAAKVRAALRERASEIGALQVPVAQAATGDLEAWRHFSRGEEILHRGTTSETNSDFALAREEYRRAAATDPGFAMAHYRIAYTLWWERRLTETREALSRAKAHLDRTTPRDREAILALDAFAEKRIPEAVVRYQALAAANPRDADVQLDLSRLFSSREAGRDVVRGIAHARRATEIAPRSGTAWEQLLECEKLQGDLGALLADAERYAASVPSRGAATWRAYALLNLGRHAEAEDAFGRMIEAFGPAGELGLAAGAVVRGDLAAAEAAYRRAAAAGDNETAVEGLYGLSWTSALRGRYREAAKRLDAVVRFDLTRADTADLTRAQGQKALWMTLATGRFPEEQILSMAAAIPNRDPVNVSRHFFWFAVTAALATGRVDVARELARMGEPLGSNHYDALLRVLRALDAGRIDDALAEWQKVRDPRDPTYGFHVPIARALLDTGRADEARRTAEATLEMPLWPHHDAVGFRAYYWPRALLVHARASAAAGDIGSAREDLERLLAVWKDAEPRTPLLQEARALRRRLLAEAR